MILSGSNRAHSGYGCDLLQPAPTDICWEANINITYAPMETRREIFQFVVINLLPLGACTSDTNSVVTIAQNTGYKKAGTKIVI